MRFENLAGAKSGAGILGIASARRLESFVLDLVNLPDNLFPRHGLPTGAAKRMFDQYPELLTDANLPNEQSFDVVATLYTLREKLRRAWDTTDDRQRHWHLFKFRESYHQARVAQIHGGHSRFLEVLRTPPSSQKEAEARLQMSDHMDSVPDATFLEAAAFHFQSVSHWARHCANPNCAVQPYFLADKSRQRYCSEVCSTPAQREAKRRWWSENRGKIK